MVTSPFVRFTTTPEQPPGQAGWAPLFVKRCSNRLEISVHLSAAGVERATNAAMPQLSSTVLRRNDWDIGEEIACIGSRMFLTAHGNRGIHAVQFLGTRSLRWRS